MKFTVYDPISGEVSHYGQCPDEAFELQAREGMDLVEGEFPGSRFYFDAGQPVEFPEKPSQFHVWDWAGKAWRADAEHAAKVVKATRAAKLRDTDWSQGGDVPEATKARWQPYRQALRDLTLQPGFPFEVNWPVPPA